MKKKYSSWNFEIYFKLKKCKNQATIMWNLYYQICKKNETDKKKERKNMILINFVIALWQKKCKAKKCNLLISIIRKEEKKRWEEYIVN